MLGPIRILQIPVSPQLHTFYSLTALRLRQHVKEYRCQDYTAVKHSGSDILITVRMAPKAEGRRLTEMNMQSYTVAEYMYKEEWLCYCSVYRCWMPLMVYEISGRRSREWWPVHESSLCPSPIHHSCIFSLSAAILQRSCCLHIFISLQHHANSYT